MLDKPEAQTICDVLFECISRVHAKDCVPEDREEMLDWVRQQLRACDVDGLPRGSSHFVHHPKLDDHVTALINEQRMLHAVIDGQRERIINLSELILKQGETIALLSKLQPMG